MNTIIKANQSHEAHMHAADVDRRGDAVMGFSHELTKHSFKTYDDGEQSKCTRRARTTRSRSTPFACI
jgi:hypothetical protein